MSGTTPLQALPYPTGTDSPAGMTEIQNLAAFLDGRIVMRFSSASARDAAITAPVEGMLAWLNDVNIFTFYTGSAWLPLMPAAYSTYSPAWTSTGTAPSLGNSAVSAAYTQFGKTVHTWGKITFGSTATFGTGSYRFSLPVAADASFIGTLGTVYVRDFGTADYFGFAAAPITATTWAATVSPGNAAWAAYGQAAPFAAAVNDFIEWNFTYQAA